MPMLSLQQPFAPAVLLVLPFKELLVPLSDVLEFAEAGGVDSEPLAEPVVPVPVVGLVAEGLVDIEPFAAMLPLPQGCLLRPVRPLSEGLVVPEGDVVPGVVEPDDVPVVPTPAPALAPPAAPPLAPPAPAASAKPVPATMTHAANASFLMNRMA